MASTQANRIAALPVEGQDEMLISTSHLTKRFGSELAVQDLTFEVPKGKIFGFIGPSGSGKTTTIRMLNGVYKPTSGEVLIFGIAPSRFNRAIRARIGYMPQHFVLYPNLSVWENLRFAATIYGMNPFKKKRLNEALDFVELTEHKHKLVREISGGMQRRLSLAATLVHDPDLIFLDEPTAGVDPLLRSRFWDGLRALRQQGRTLFITTQYVSEAAYCDLVGVMKAGQLLVIDTPQGLRYRAYGGDVINLVPVKPIEASLEDDLRAQPFIGDQNFQIVGKSLRVVVKQANTAMPAILEWCRAHQIEVEAIEEFQPPFDEVFVELVKQEQVDA